LTAIIEAAALLIQLGYFGMSFECRVRIGRVVFGEWFAGLPAAERVWLVFFVVLRRGCVVVRLNSHQKCLSVDVRLCPLNRVKKAAGDRTLSGFHIFIMQLSRAARRS
jgi:hypothetical protein